MFTRPTTLSLLLITAGVITLLLARPRPAEPSAGPTITTAVDQIVDAATGQALPA
jgi:hypothetical protein